MRVLVTGGTGFVGSHSVAALLGAGHEVRLLVRDSARVERALGPLNVSVSDVVVGDMTDPEAVARAVQGRDAVVHAAALFTFDPRRIANIGATNVRGTEVVLEAACKAGCDPAVHVSRFAALLPQNEALTAPRVGRHPTRHRRVAGRYRASVCQSRRPACRALRWDRSKRGLASQRQPTPAPHANCYSVRRLRNETNGVSDTA